ncbi:uncharacterized protein LOC121384574 isoform X2 [Gigantopelta aegis]|uniref:uncharacterized protein LOC121384574 isoform X2 n=1 Tax=Gigantopelta aegis TaxID=1735272 RepID=UPI001B888D26|nr:uncharacterized protein LOC121384574 isoform X2 [Gigantopelta aegis]
MAAKKKNCFVNFICILIALGFGTCTGTSFQEVHAEVQSIEKVHIIFMNHLDVGYNGIPKKTGFVNNVINTYFTEYFPRAINLSQELRKGEYVESFIYTTHPWLVSLYLDCPDLVLNQIPLKCPNATEKSAFKAAVQRGDIAWHAGPMNMQPENMNKLVFELGLNISLNVDAMFGIKRRFAALSQRDVPGMTQSVVPSLVKYGVAAVSVGVNSGTSPPAVHNPFLWRFEGSEVIGFWHPGGYPENPGPTPGDPHGLSKKNCLIIEGFSQVLCFAFRSDNSGPPLSVQEILGNYEILRTEFPGAQLEASTFDRYIESLQPIKHTLPVGTFEVGDTWIQGIASDPVKMSKYWTFSNTLQDCFLSQRCQGDDPRIKNAARFLVKLPEHTWGLPTVYDNINWSNKAFEKVRNGKNFTNCVKSWVEQRAFLDLALQSLGTHPVASEIKQNYDLLTPKQPSLTGYKRIDNYSVPFICSDGIRLQFGSDGSLANLFDPYNQINWASGGKAMGQMLYTTFNESDFENMAKQYNYYAYGAGYDKPNSTKNANPLSQNWNFFISDLYKNEDTSEHCDFLVKLVPKDRESYELYGAPRKVWIQYTSRSPSPQGYPGGLDVTVQWFQKTSTRLAESLSFNFMPVSQSSHRWLISKTGHLVDPANVVKNGSQYVHATDNGAFYLDKDGNGLQLITQNVPLVYVGTKAHPPSPFPVPLDPIKQEEITSMAFNFYNNIWNTNYILWYPYLPGEDSFKGRFKINFYTLKN